MKKRNILSLASFMLFSLVGCEDNQSVINSEETYTTIVSEFNEIDIEVDETYTLSYLLKSNTGMSAEINSSNVADLTSDIITGKEVGEASLILSMDGKKQLVKVNVHDKGALSSTFSFDIGRLANKKIVAFGDSVTANATIGGANTYYNNFANKYRMIAVKNYAIGGTTATYMYEGSNIYKEYANNTTAIDGVRVVKGAYDNDELKNIDYAFIAYGHNDQYFQAPISVTGDNVYNFDSFDSCHSFKGSYRYMIETLKLANPNIRILLLNCTYSEYDKSNISSYGKVYNYSDYRQAIKEIAEEFSLTHIDPWDYLEMYYDNFDNKYYYKDSVHLSEAGHLILTQYIISIR